MGFGTWVKDLLRNWLDIKAGNPLSVNIQEPYSFETSVFRNQLWYRGDAAELHQFYTQTDDYMNNTSFWAATSSTGVSFRKIHTGLPALVVTTLTDIVVADMTDVSIKNADGQTRWDEIAKENKFLELLKTVIRKTLVEGDGAFKISYDPELSKLPIIEYFSGESLRYEYSRGRLKAICFLTKKFSGGNTYILNERYSVDGIEYTLYNNQGLELPLTALDELSDLQNIINPDKFMMAVPLMFDSSPKYEGRGKSIFDSKSGCFDAFDECVSQWVDSMRDARTNKYIPDTLLPKDPDTGATLRANSFDNRYIATGADLAETARNIINVVHGEIPDAGLDSSYRTLLDLCLQGLISPSTLGVDVKKLDNAEAQREKEKTTLYTRNKIVEKLESVIPLLVETVLKTEDKLKNASAGTYEVSVSFGEYANPSFEAQIETLSKAKTGGIMSTELIVEELWGNSKTDAEKAEEVKRLKDEQGTAEVDPGGSEDDINNQGSQLSNNLDDSGKLPLIGSAKSDEE